MSTIVYAFRLIIDLYILVVFINVIASWLIAFNIINSHNQLVRTILDFCHAMTEPLLRPIRQFIPPISGFDISPIILLLGLQIFEHFMLNQVFPLLS